MKNRSGFEVHPKRKILLGCISISRNRFLQVYKSFCRSLRFPGLARLQSVNAVNRRFYFVRSEREFRLIAADSQSRFLFFTIRIIKPYHGFRAYPFHGKQGDPFSFDTDLRIFLFSPVLRRFVEKGGRIIRSPRQRGVGREDLRRVIQTFVTPSPSAPY